MTPPVCRQQKQKGVALIMAMMIAALVTAIAIEVLWRFELNISRSGNRWAGMQAKAYLEGAEHLAMVVLKEDAEGDDTSKADHMGETWAQDAEPFPTDHGYVTGKIEDAHGRFNINLMRTESGFCPGGQQKSAGPCPNETLCKEFGKSHLVFMRLLQTLNLADESEEDPEPIFLEQDQAQAITEAIIDWLDDDSELQGFGGAESDYYDQLEPPVSIANSEMISVSELQVIKGMNPVIYEKLLPYIIALPKKSAGYVNINTAVLPIIQSAKPNEPCDPTPYDQETGQTLFDFVRGGEFTDWEEMRDDPGFPSEWSDGGQVVTLPQDLFRMSQSTYFLFFSEAGIGEDHIRRGTSLIRRGSGNVDDEDDENQPPARADGEGEDENGSSGRQQAQGADTEIEVVRRSDANF